HARIVLAVSDAVAPGMAGIAGLPEEARPLRRPRAELVGSGQRAGPGEGQGSQGVAVHEFPGAGADAAVEALLLRKPAESLPGRLFETAARGAGLQDRQH